MLDLSEHIKILVRLKPTQDLQKSVMRQDENTLHLIKEKKEKEAKTFTFDYIADEDASQLDIFERGAKQICDSVLQGYNGTIFAYGQTGAGKTYSLLGPRYNMGEFNEKSYHLKSEDGLLPRSVEYIFDKINSVSIEDILNQTTIFNVYVSFLEIYNENISDLLGINNCQISIREDSNKRIVVDGITKEKVNNTNDCLNMLCRGLKNRHTGSTNMNKESSRSHAIFSLHVENKITNKNTFKVIKSVFHLIDLAGSERQKSTDATGTRLKEAGSINKSLMNLGQVISRIAENESTGKQNKFIPYRDSKLTQLLKDSIAGNSRTCIVANISCQSIYYNETLTTLQFAQNAKSIKNRAVINEEFEYSREEIKFLLEKLNFLENERNQFKLLIDSKKTTNTNNYNINLMCTSGENRISDDSIMINIKEPERIKYVNQINEAMKNKILHLEAAAKLKEEFEELCHHLRNENKILKSQLREYVIINANEVEKIKESEFNFKDKETLLSSKIEHLNIEINDLKITIESKENSINKLYNDISENNRIIRSKDLIINDLNSQNQQLKNQIESFQKILMDTKNDYKELQNQVNDKNNLISNLESKLKDKDSYVEEVKKKGKELLEAYSNKIVTLNNEITSKDKEKNGLFSEIAKLNTIISDLKIEKERSDEKYFKSNDQNLKLMKTIDENKEKIQQKEEDNTILVNEINKLNLRIEEMIGENSKSRWFTNVKEESKKLITENAELKKKLLNIDKIMKSISGTKEKPKLEDIKVNYETLTQQFNELKDFLNKATNKMFEFYNQSNIFKEANLNSYFSLNSTENKCEYLLDKIFKQLKIYNKMIEVKREEIESKNLKIMNLEKEINFKTGESSKENNIFPFSTKKLKYTDFSLIKTSNSTNEKKQIDKIESYKKNLISEKYDDKNIEIPGKTKKLE